MKKSYMTPEFEIVNLTVRDAILTSGSVNSDPESGYTPIIVDIDEEDLA